MGRADLKAAKLARTVEFADKLVAPAGGAWNNAAREAAYDRLCAMGLPEARDEYWRYTKSDTLTSFDAPSAALYPADEPLFAGVDCLRIVFVDGVYSPEDSDPLELAGLEITRLQDAMDSDIHWAQGLYGVLEADGQAPVERPLAALNTVVATDGILIRATGKAAKPVSLKYKRSSETAHVTLHHVIHVEEGAELTLLEDGPAAARFSCVTEVEVADKGAFHHIRVQGRDPERRMNTHLFARLGEASVFKSFTLSLNGVLTRNEAVLTLTGDNAAAHVAGAVVGDGTDFHHDDTVFITHDAVDCESRQVFKKVLRNGATGVFQGKILVKPDAQKTDGYQISQSLLLDEDSQFLAKPELEIYADDVACSHGSTSGAIDEEGLFYLRSRGVPLAEATDLMVLAFLAEALEEIEDEALAEDLSDRLAGWLSRHRG